MKKYDEQVLTMFRQANQYMTDNETAITATGVVIIGATNTNIADEINAIDALLPESAATTVNETTAKNDAKLAVAIRASTVAASVYAFAIDTANFPLKAQMRPYIAVSNLSKLKDEEIIPVAQNIHAAATTNVASLEDYGTDAAILTAFAGQIAAYEALIETVYMAIEARKTANETIKTHFENIRMYLEITDNAFYVVKDSVGDLELAAGYFNARNIFDPVVTHTGFRGTVKDAVTLMPIQGVKVTAIPSTIPPPGEAGIPVIGYTDENGYYTIATPQYKNNPYTIIWSKTGYAELQTTGQYIKRGKKNTINVSLEL